jgi:hypothetical protein
MTAAAQTAAPRSSITRRRRLTGSAELNLLSVKGR